MLHSQALELPITKTLYPGTNVIQYGGQTLVFNNSVMLKVRLAYTALLRFEVSVARHPSATEVEGASGTEQMAITWEDYQQLLYDGVVPSDGWVAELNLTEGGWVEK